MGFFDSLQKLIPKINIKIDLREFIKFQIVVINNNDKPAIEPKNSLKELHVNLAKIDPDSRQELLCNSILRDDELLLEKDSKELIENFRRVDGEKNRKITEVLKNRIPSTDIPILRAAFFLKEEFETGKNTQGLKEDIIARYGERGRKIANICSAGYFESVIIPTLEEMKASGSFSKENFQKIYDTFIYESGYAVFVHGAMSKEKIVKVILEKIRTNLKYGLKHINIHGIGKQTIKHIRPATDELLGHYSGLEKTADNIFGNTILIKLEFGGQLNEQLDNF